MKDAVSTQNIHAQMKAAQRRAQENDGTSDWIAVPKYGVDIKVPVDRAGRSLVHPDDAMQYAAEQGRRFHGAGFSGGQGRVAHNTSSRRRRNIPRFNRLTIPIR